MTLSLHHVTKRFDDNLVVNQVSLEVKSGELFVLLGSSGSGKSTVLRLIAGLTSLDAGTIVHEGRDLTSIAPQDRQIGFVFQNYALFKHMTVRRNIGFALELRKASKQELATRVEELLDLVGLVGLGSRYPHELSGGQRQRVALARALAHRPKLLLLDEPFGALDQEIRGALRQNLAKIQRTLGITAILVTHDQEEAFELGDRVGVVDRGILLESGKPEELYARPTTEHVAQFVGGGNVLVGRYESGAIPVGERRIPLPPSAPLHSEGAPVRILFRPEQVMLSPHGSASASALLPLGRGVIAEASFAGPLRRYRVELEKLAGVRSPIPRLQYGRGAISLGAVQPSTIGAALRVGDRVEVSAQAFHVLNPSSVRTLGVLDARMPDPCVVEMGLYFGAKTHGVLSFTAVAETPAQRQRVTTLVGECATRTGNKIDLASQLHLYTAHPVRSLVEEAQASLADLVLAASKGSASLGTLVEHILARARSPVLCVAKNWRPLRRILICTKGGEPGKHDILIGARIARHTDAAVTVLHVQPSNPTTEYRRSIERHLDEAQATLSNLRIDHDVLILDGPVASCLQKVVGEAAYDLVVLGVAIGPHEDGFQVVPPPVESFPSSVSVLLVPLS